MMTEQKIEDKINKTREGLIKRKLISEEDYQMAEGWTERYETFDKIRKVRPYNVTDSKYIISESDKIKGRRESIIDINTGEIIEEIK